MAWKWCYTAPTTTAIVSRNHRDRNLWTGVSVQPDQHIVPELDSSMTTHNDIPDLMLVGKYDNRSLKRSQEDLYNCWNSISRQFILGTTQHLRDESFSHCSAIQSQPSPVRLKWSMNSGVSPSHLCAAYLLYGISGSGFGNPSQYTMAMVNSTTDATRDTVCR